VFLKFRRKAKAGRATRDRTIKGKRKRMEKKVNTSTQAALTF